MHWQRKQAGVPAWRLSRVPLRALFGSALLLFGLGAVLLSAYVDSRETAFGVELSGGNRPVNAGAADPVDISAHNSPTVVRSPVDAANLAVANRIDTPSFSCALHVSSDGGARWSQISIPEPEGEAPKCFAPDVAFGADGTLYLSFVTLEGRGNVPSAAWIATLGRGSEVLSPPVKTPLPELSFQVRLVADPITPKRVYLTWLQAADTGVLRFTGPGNPIQFARSDDGGSTWEPPVRVSDQARGRVLAPSLAPGPGRELYVLYLDLGEDTLDYEGGHEGHGGPPYPGRWQLILSRSLDGGSTWEETVVEDALVPTERLVALFPPYPSLAVDRSSGRVYAAFQDGRLGDPDVRVWASGDRGATWEGPSRVNDTPERDRRAQYLPELAVSPTGRLDVVYYDRRSDPGNVLNEVSFQSSVDGGRSFAPRVRLSDRPFDSRIGFGSERELPDLGSRLGLLSAGSRALAVWTDTRAGTEASNKQDLASAFVAVTERSGPSRLVRDALRYAGLGLAVLGVLLVAPPLALLRKRARDAAPAGPPEASATGAPPEASAPQDAPGASRPGARPGP